MPGATATLGYSQRVRRIERLINLIAALLETDRPMTADEIRERIAGYEQSNFEAFRRAFERDKQDLRAMGIPVELVHSGDAFKEQPDAYIIPKERYYLPQLDLEPDEVAALRLAAEAILGAGEEASSGLMKLSLDAPTSPWSGPKVVWGADVAAEQPHLGPLYGALLDRAPVTFGYERPAGDTSTRHLHPYGLVHRRGNWYVVGHDVDRGAIRAFKLTRIRDEVQRGEGSYEIPEDFDARSHIAGESFEVAGAESSSAVIRFAPTLRWWAEQAWPDAETTETEDGGVLVELPVANADALVSWAIGFGNEVEIVEPRAARTALLEHLQPFLGSR